MEGMSELIMLPFSQSCENNKHVIADILRDAFADAERILEIGSGTGQHAVHLAACLPHLVWQPSDIGGRLEGLGARIGREAPGNVAPPVELDVATESWPVCGADGVFSANCVHIIGRDLVACLFRGVGRVLGPAGTLCLYGPFRYGGEFTTESNAEFDAWLRARDPRSGVRDFEDIDRLAQAQGLRLLHDHAMPANNRLPVWRRA